MACEIDRQHENAVKKLPAQECSGVLIQHELLLVIDESNGKATSDQALECMSELTAYDLQLSTAIELPSVSPESDAMPWKPKALLFDEAHYGICIQSVLPGAVL